jgi:hypothetical protein
MLAALDAVCRSTPARLGTSAIGTTAATPARSIGAAIEGRQRTKPNVQT